VIYPESLTYSTPTINSLLRQQTSPISSHGLWRRSLVASVKSTAAVLTSCTKKRHKTRMSSPCSRRCGFGRNFWLRNHFQRYVLSISRHDGGY